MGWFFNDNNISNNFNQMKIFGFFLVLLGIFIHNYANAETYTPTVTYTTDPVSTFPASFQFTLAATCTTYTNNYKSAFNMISITVNACDLQPTATQITANVTAVNSAGNTVQFPTMAVGSKLQDACPVGSNGNGLNPPRRMCTITCTAPQVFNTFSNTCKLPDPCLPLKGIHVTKLFYDGDVPTICKNNCIITISNSVCSGISPFSCAGDGKFTGSECTPTTPAIIPNTPEHDCLATGQSYGTVNGVVVCTKTGTTGTPPIKTTALADSKSSTTSNNVTNTTTSNTTTTSNSETNTVNQTTTTTNPDGSTKTESKEQDSKSFCESNPNSAMCKSEQKSSCEQNPEGPECKHHCQKFPDSLSCVKASDYIGDPSQLPIGNPSTGTFNFPSNISNVSMTEVNSCPADYSVTIGGRVIPFEYTWLCDYASAFKPIVVSFALLAALYIVYGAISGSSSKQGRIF